MLNFSQRDTCILFNFTHARSNYPWKQLCRSGI
jgi:hypothetical protein